MLTSPRSLVLFLVLYFFCAVFVYGLAVPSGLFVPGMLMGGALGRMVGELFYLAGGVAANADPGLYALVGAAGMLGGVTRMTMSLAIIIVELTNDVDLLLPIMLAIGVAKQVGDSFNRSLYDIHIGLQGVPMLEDKIESIPFHVQGKLNARSVMADKVVCVGEAEPAFKLRELLRRTKHNGFPLVRKSDGSLADRKYLFVGLITRAKIQKALEASDALVPRIKARRGRGPAELLTPRSRSNSTTNLQDLEATPYEPPASAPAASAQADSQRITFSRGGPDAPGPTPAASPSPSEAEDDELAPMRAVSTSETSGPGPSPAAARRRRNSKMLAEELSRAVTEGAPMIDLRPFCDRSPYVVNEFLPLQRVFRLFQTMGLRHLPVTDEHSCVVGIITRRDLLDIDRASAELLASRRREESRKRLAQAGDFELDHALRVMDGEPSPLKSGLNFNNDAGSTFTRRPGQFSTELSSQPSRSGNSSRIASVPTSRSVPPRSAAAQTKETFSSVCEP